VQSETERRGEGSRHDRHADMDAGRASVHAGRASARERERDLLLLGSGQQRLHLSAELADHLLHPLELSFLRISRVRDGLSHNDLSA
jgi:hypothetical protein